MLSNKFNIKKLGITLFLLILSSYSALTLWTSLVIPPTGDEPYYLLATQSLTKDKDLDISNNYQAHQWRDFLPKEQNLQIWPSPRQDGKIYLDQRVLFINLLTIPYFLGKFLGTSLFMCLISSLFIFIIFQYLIAVGFPIKKSFWTALLVAFVQPMISMNSRIYHNILGALLILIAFLYLTYKQKNYKSSVIASLIILSLPWLHMGYTAFSLTLGILFILNYKQKKTYLFTFMLFAVIDTTTFAFYRANIQSGVSDFFAIQQYRLTTNIHRSLLALFFDQEAGLFFQAPVYILSMVGISTLFFIDKSCKFAGKILFLISGFILLQGGLGAFGGGYDTGRSLIQILPFIAVFLCRVLSETKLKLISFLLIIISCFQGFLSSAIPWVSINFETGKNIFLKQLSGYLPTFIIKGQEHYSGIILCIFFLVLMTPLLITKTKFDWR